MQVEVFFFCEIEQNKNVKMSFFFIEHFCFKLPIGRKINTKCDVFIFLLGNQSSYGHGGQQMGGGYSGGYSNQSSMGGYNDYSAF